MPSGPWTEQYIETLPREDNTLERKRSALLDIGGGANEGSARGQLAKQLSAFSNTGGGSIILGVDDHGRIDGGIPLVVKGRQTTKEWLEDIIPHLTEPEIIGFRVVEIRRENKESKIHPDRAVYVIEVPDSQRAPHQSKEDMKYYVRLSGKSHPATHRIIEDIRNRTRHPRLEVCSIAIAVADYVQGYLRFRLEVAVRNTSRMRASNVCLALSGPSLMTCSWIDTTQATVRGGSAPGALFLELAHTVYPDMELIISPQLTTQADLHRPVPVSNPAMVPAIQWASLSVGGHDIRELILATTLYADSAPAFRQTFSFDSIDSKRRLEDLLRRYS